eukprot:4833356-Prymnesium_polylepis.1
MDVRAALNIQPPLFCLLKGHQPRASAHVTNARWREGHALMRPPRAWVSRLACLLTEGSRRRRRRPRAQRRATTCASDSR